MSRFSCAVTPSTREAIANRIVTIVKEEGVGNITFDKLCARLWNENFSKFVIRDKTVFALDCLSQVPMIIWDNIRTQSDADPEVYKLLTVAFENDKSKISDLDSKLRNYDWYDVAVGMVNGITLTNNDKTVLARINIAQQYIPKAHSNNVEISEGSYTITDIGGEPTLCLVVSIQDGIVVTRPVNAYGEFINDTSYPIGTVENMRQLYTAPSSIFSSAIHKESFRNGQFQNVSLIEFRPNYIKKPDGITELFFNAKKDGKDMKISFRSQECPEIFMISSDFGNIKDEKDYKSVYCKVLKKNSDLNTITFEVISPYIKSDVENVEMVKREIEVEPVSLEGATFSTMTKRLFYLSQVAQGSSTTIDNIYTLTEYNNNIHNKFIYNVKKSSVADKTMFNGTEIALKANINTRGNIALSVCDLEGNELKFSINDNDCIIEDENGMTISFLFDDILGLTDNYNVSLQHIDYNKTIEQNLRSYFGTEAKYNNFANRLEQAKIKQKEIKRRIENGEKVMFKITNIDSNFKVAYSMDKTSDFDEEEIFLPSNQPYPSIMQNGTQFYLIMPVMNESNLNYFTSLLSENLFTNNEKTSPLSNSKRFDILKSFFSKKDSAKIMLSDGSYIGMYLVGGNLYIQLEDIDGSNKLIASFDNNGKIKKENGFNEAIEKFKSSYSKEAVTSTGKSKGWSKYQLTINRENISNKTLYQPSIIDGVIDIEQKPINKVLKDSFGYKSQKFYQEKDAPNGSLQFQIMNEELKEQPSKQEVVDEGKSNDDGLNIDSFFTSIEAKSHITGASEQEIYEAKKWFNSNPISKIVGFEPMFNIANNLGVAEWNKYGIILYKGSDYSDLYHEAWHEYSQYLLTKDEKNDMYTEFRKIKGEFTDHEGKKVSYKEASDLQAEEKLAEMFREYMIKNNNKTWLEKKIPWLYKLFRKIYDMVKYIAGPENKIEVVFDRLRFGNLKGSTKNKSNLKFTKLYRSVNCVNQNNDKFRLSENDSYYINNLMNSCVVEYLEFKSMFPNVTDFPTILSYMEIFKNEGKEAANDKFKTKLPDIMNFRKFTLYKFVGDNKEDFDEKSKSDSKEFLSTLHAAGISVSDILQKSDELKNAMMFAKAKMIQLNLINDSRFARAQNKGDLEKMAAVNSQIVLLNTAIDNFGNINTLGLDKEKNDVGVVGYYIKSNEFFSEIEEEEVDLDDTERMLREEHDPDPNSKSTQQRLDNELKFLLSTIPAYKLDETGKYVVETNEFGMQKAKNLIAVVNLLNFLHGCTDAKTAYEKMRRVAYASNNGIVNENRVVNPIIKTILDRLGNYDFEISPDDNGVLDSLSDRELKRFQLWTKFFNVYATSEPIYYQTNIDVNKGTSATDELQQVLLGVNVSVGEFSGYFWKFKSLYESKYFDVTNNSKYINDTEKGRLLDVKAVLKDFTLERAKQEKIKFIQATGLDMTFSLGNELAMKTQEWDTKIELIYDKLKQLSNTDVSNPVEEIYNSFKKGTKYLRSVLKDIIELDASCREDVNIEMMQNAEGSTMFKNQLNNTILILCNHINKAESYLDMLNDPALKHLDVRPKVFVDGKWIDNENFNPIAAQSTILNKIFKLNFNEDGTYGNNFGAKYDNVSLKITNFSGIKVNETGNYSSSEGVKMFSADIDAKLIADIALMLNNQYEFMRFADKGSSYGMTLVNGDKKGFAAFDTTRMFTLSNGDVVNECLQTYRKYLISEINRLLMVKQIKKDVKNGKYNYDRNYLSKAENFGVFDDILSSETKSKLLNDVDKRLNETGRKYLTENDFDLLYVINDDLKKYIKEKKNEIKDKLTELDGKYPKLIDSFKRMVDPHDEILSQYNYTDSSFIERLSVLMHVNTQINNFESLKLFFGDIMCYNHAKEEFTKRVGGFGSTGLIFNYDETTVNIINSMGRSSYAKRVLSIESNIFDEGHEGELKTAVCADMNPITPYLDDIKKILPSSFAESYERIEEESNAQGLITFDAYRNLSLMEGTWTTEQEKLFQKILDREIYERSDKENWKGEIPDEINWADTVKFFPVRKFQYIGPLRTESMPLTAFHKYSLMPLIPNMVKDRNLQYIHDRMVREGITYITFNSGSKMSNVTKRDAYYVEDAEGNIKKDSRIKGNGDLLYDIDRLDYKNRIEGDEIMARTLLPGFYETGGDNMFTPNYIPVAYLKDQLSIHDELESKTILSTQLKRLIENNLFDSGVPYDYLNNSTDKDAARSEWRIHYNNYISGREDDSWLSKNSKYFELSKRFEDTISKLTGFAIQSIKDDFGIGKNSNEEIQKKVFDFIKTELDKKGVPQHLSEGMTNINELQFSFAASQVENILMSLINSRVIRQKIHGGQFIQVAGTMWEKPGTVVAEVDNPVANELGFYSPEVEGGTEFKVNKDYSVKPAHCKIPLAGDYVHLLRLYHTDGKRIDTLDRLNECLKDDKWCDEHKDFIRIIAVRIPVQGHNSMEYLKIQEFVAPGSNNIIVCPTELVIKSGGDYDIDKLSCVLPNISNINGEAFVVKPSDKKVDKKLLGKLRKEMIAKDKAYSSAINSAFKKLVNGANITKEIQDYAIKLHSDLVEVSARLRVYEADLEESDLTDEEYLALERQYDSLKEIKNKIWDEIYELVKDDADVNAKKAEYKEANLKYANEKSKFLSTSRIAYENQLIDIMSEILSLKANNATLLTPNSNIIYAGKGNPANVLEMNADYNKLDNVFGGEGDVMSPTRCTEYMYNLHKHDDFNVGKTILGPAAIDNVFSSLLRRVGAYMNHTSMTSIDSDVPARYTESGKILENGFDLNSSEQRQKLIEAIVNDIRSLQIESEVRKTSKKGDKIRNNTYAPLSNKRIKSISSDLSKLLESVCKYSVQTMKLPHNTVMINGEECIDISSNFCKTTPDAQKFTISYIENGRTIEKEVGLTINEEISEYITGCVDVAKGAWVKYIQGNMEAIPTFMYMIQAGVPSDYACYFIANPLIRKYLDAKLQLRSNADLLKEKNFSLTNNNILRASLLGINTTNKNVAIVALYDTMNALREQPLEMNIETLRQRATSRDITDYDRQLLTEFFFIEDQAEIINQLKLSVRVDATKNNNVFNVLSKQDALEKISDDQRIDKNILDAIKKDTVISSFFQDIFIKELVDYVLPYRLNKKLLDSADKTLDYITLKSLPSADIEVETRRYQTEFFNYLFQKDLKTLDGSAERIFDDEVYNLAISYADYFSHKFKEQRNKVEKFIENLNNLINYYKGHEEEMRNSYTYKYITGKFKSGNKDMIFYTYFALIKSGDTEILFNDRSKNFPDLFMVLINELKQSNPESFKSFLFFDSINSIRGEYRQNIPSTKIYVDKNAENGTETITKKEKNVYSQVTKNLMFTMNLSANEIGVIHENINNLSDIKWLRNAVRNSTQKVIKNERIGYDGYLSDIDLNLICSMVRFLPTFSILQSGLNSSVSQSLNSVFDNNNMFNKLYNDFISMTDKQQEALLDSFSGAFLSLFSKYNPLRLRNYSYNKFEFNDDSDIFIDETAPEDNTPIFVEDESDDYTSRTKKNASADVTIAFATDFTTGGEKATERLVNMQNKKYIGIDINSDVDNETIDMIVGELNDTNAKSLNIAGNGMYTLIKKFKSQKEVDDLIYSIMEKIINHPNLNANIEYIRSGGQTGVDEAGIKAAMRLGIKSVVVAPKGWKFKTADGKTITNKDKFQERFVIDIPAQVQTEEVDNEIVEVSPEISFNKQDLVEMYDVINQLYMSKPKPNQTADDSYTNLDYLGYKDFVDWFKKNEDFILTLKSNGEEFVENNIKFRSINQFVQYSKFYSLKNLVLYSDVNGNSKRAFVKRCDSIMNEILVSNDDNKINELGSTEINTNSKEIKRLVDMFFGDETFSKYGVHDWNRRKKEAINLANFEITRQCATDVKYITSKTYESLLHLITFVSLSSNKNILDIINNGKDIDNLLSLKNKISDLLGLNQNNEVSDREVEEGEINCKSM